MENRYGINPGAFNEHYLEMITTCSEQDLYIQIANISFVIGNTLYKSGSKAIREKMEKDAYTLDFAKYQATRFGVIFNEPNEERLVESDTYKLWYKAWNDYFTKEITKEELREFKLLKRDNKDTSMFKPSYDWRDKIKEGLFIKKLER